MARVKVTRRTRSGRTVTYYQNRKAGMSQSRSKVAKSGLRWGGRTFKTRAALATWLKAHGSSIKTFDKKHPRASAGLRSRGKAKTRAAARVTREAKRARRVGTRKRRVTRGRAQRAFR